MRVADMQTAIRRVLDAWEETKHPRGKGGKFSKKGEGGSGSASTSPSAPKAEKPKKRRAAAAPKQKVDLIEENVAPDKLKSITKKPKAANPIAKLTRSKFDAHIKEFVRSGAAEKQAKLYAEEERQRKARDLQERKSRTMVASRRIGVASGNLDALYMSSNPDTILGMPESDRHPLPIEARQRLGVEIDNLNKKIYALKGEDYHYEYFESIADQAESLAEKFSEESRIYSSSQEWQRDLNDIISSYRKQFAAWRAARSGEDRRKKKSKSSPGSSLSLSEKSLKAKQKGVLPAKEFIRQVVEEARARGVKMPKPASMVKLVEAFDRHHKEHVLLDIADLVLKRAREQRPEASVSKPARKSAAGGKTKAAPTPAAEQTAPATPPAAPRQTTASPHAEELDGIDAAINADRGDARASMRRWPAAMRAALEGQNGDGPAILPYRGQTANIRSPEEYADAVRRSTMTASGAVRRIAKQIADFVEKTRVIPRAPR